MLNFFKRDKDKKTEKLEEVVENKNIEQAVEAPANEKKKNRVF